LAASLAAATPLKPSNPRDVALALGSPDTSFSSHSWEDKRFLDHEQTVGDIVLDLRKEVTTFDLHSFGQIIEERDTVENAMTPASPLLVKRRK
jgi:hypothetical protein